MILLRPPKEETNCCAVILSGGLNSRMGGKNKGFLEVGGRSILDRLLENLQPAFGEILLVTRDPRLYADYPVKIVTDLYEDRSSLTGIHAAMVGAQAEHGFVVPCDTPFLQPGMIRLLLDALEPGVDVVVPLVDTHYEPLCAIYSKRCVPVIEMQLRQKDYTIYNFFDRVQVKTISKDEIKQVDPDLLSFFNVNTPEAYQSCLKMVSNKQLSSSPS